jgi:hypothetical protein
MHGAVFVRLWFLHDVDFLSAAAPDNAATISEAGRHRKPLSAILMMEKNWSTNSARRV